MRPSSANAEPLTHLFGVGRFRADVYFHTLSSCPIGAYPLLEARQLQLGNVSAAFDEDN